MDHVRGISQELGETETDVMEETMEYELHFEGNDFDKIDDNDREKNAESANDGPAMNIQDYRKGSHASLSPTS